MEYLLIFSVIGLILALGFLSEILFRKTGIPDVLILIGFGLFLRYGVGIVSPEYFGNGTTLFTTFALLFILFQGSLSIDFRTLIQSAGSALRLTIFTFLISVTLVTSILMILTVFDVIQFNFLSALLLGSILGGTSSMVVVPMLQNMGMNGKSKSVLVLESAISDVLCILTSLTIVEAITTGNIVASEVSRSLLASFGLSILVGAVIGVTWVFTLEKFTSLARAYIVNIGLVLMLYAAVESSFVAASGPIACLTFGLMLRNSKSILLLNKNKEKEDVKPILTAEAKNFYAEISFLLKATFFVYLGILINIQNYLALSLGLVFTIVIYLARPLIVRTIFKKELSVDPLSMIMHSKPEYV